MNLLHLKCPKCEYKARKDDYICPKCKVKFRPKSVVIISGIMLLFGLLNLSPIQIIFSIGIFLMKQWARRWLIIGIIAQALLFLVLAGFDIKQVLAPSVAINLIIFIIVFIPMAIYLLKNEEVIEAFEFYGGRL